MTLLNTINIGGTDFGIMNSTVVGVSATPAGSEIKETTFTDGFELKAGNVVTVKFTYANTYGDGSTTYPKLTVAGVTGAIRNSNGSYATTGAWGNQALVPFLYDGVDFTILYNTVVNEVTANNMYSVTSNAVANFAFDKSRVRTGRCTNGSADNDDWIVTFDVPFQNSNYIVVVAPSSYGGAGYCPSGWYIIGKGPTGFSIYCKGDAPANGFEYIAINYS